MLIKPSFYKLCFFLTPYILISCILLNFSSVAQAANPNSSTYLLEQRLAQVRLTHDQTDYAQTEQILGGRPLILEIDDPRAQEGSTGGKPLQASSQATAVSVIAPSVQTTAPPSVNPTNAPAVQPSVGTLPIITSHSEQNPRPARQPARRHAESFANPYFQDNTPESSAGAMFPEPRAPRPTRESADNAQSVAAFEPLETLTPLETPQLRSGVSQTPLTTEPYYSSTNPLTVQPRQNGPYKSGLDATSIIAQMRHANPSFYTEILESNAQYDQYDYGMHAAWGKFIELFGGRDSVKAADWYEAWFKARTSHIHSLLGNTQTNQSPVAFMQAVIKYDTQALHFLETTIQAAAQREMRLFFFLETLRPVLYSKNYSVMPWNNTAVKQALALLRATDTTVVVTNKGSFFSTASYENIKDKNSIIVAFTIDGLLHREHMTVTYPAVSKSKATQIAEYQYTPINNYVNWVSVSYSEQLANGTKHGLAPAYYLVKANTVMGVPLPVIPKLSSFYRDGSPNLGLLIETMKSLITRPNNTAYYEQYNGQPTPQLYVPEPTPGYVATSSLHAPELTPICPMEPIFRPYFGTRSFITIELIPNRSFAPCAVVEADYSIEYAWNGARFVPAEVIQLYEDEPEDDGSGQIDDTGNTPATPTPEPTDPIQAGIFLIQQAIELSTSTNTNQNSETPSDMFINTDTLNELDLPTTLQ